MSIDYEEIGKYTHEKAEEFKKLFDEAVSLALESDDIRHRIVKAETDGATEEVEKLYVEFRQIYDMQKSNEKYRHQKFEEFFHEIYKMEESYE